MRADEKNIYLQWLNKRQPLPVRLGLGYNVAIWVLGFLSLLVFTVIAVLTDIIYFTPRALNEDFKNPTGRQIFASPLPSGDILNDLRRWARARTLYHSIPLLIFAPLIITFIIVALLSIFTFQGLFFFMYIFMLYMLFHAVLESGVLLAVMPSWFPNSGLQFVIVLPVTLALIYGFPIWYFSIVNDIYENNSLILMIILLMSAVLILAALRWVLETLNLRLMDLKRRGGWQ